MSSIPEQPGQLNIEISEEVSEGAYANLAIITHSHAEFVIDFVNVMPGTPKSKVKSRIILTPFHAKRFMKAMIDNVVATVTKGDTVVLPGFGTFKFTKRAARTGKHPKTGAALKIAATTVPKFTAGTIFKTAVATTKKKKK